MKKINVVIILLLVHTINLHAGGPWPQSKGVGYFKLSEWWIVFDEHYTDSGKRDPNTATGIFNTFLYAEYGFTDRLTGIFNGAVFGRNYMNNRVSATSGALLTKGESLNSIGDIDVGVKYGITKKGAKIPISISLILGVPTGENEGGSQKNLQTGDGEFNQLLVADIGRGFKLSEKVSGYTSGFLGYNNRTQSYSDEFRFGLEFGVGLLNSRLWLIGRLSGVESLKNGETAESVNSTSIFANNTEYTSFGLEASYYVAKRVGVSIGAASAFRGEIIAAAPSYTVGVFYDMSR